MGLSVLDFSSSSPMRSMSIPGAVTYPFSENEGLFEMSSMILG
jgi:hypothetical protein